MRKQPKILLLDIETSPLLAYIWSLWDQNTPLVRLESEWCILSFCGKWLGDPRIIYHDNRHRKDKEDDTILLRKLWKLLDEADMVIAHNGKKFDMRKIKARMLLLGLPPFSPVHVIDTMLEVRKNFAMTSNKLEYLTAKLCTERKSSHGKFPGFVLWRECLKGNLEAWQEMEAYNVQDVISMEELYLKIRPWIQGHPNVGNYNDYTPEEGQHYCPNCGSDNVIRKGTRNTQVGVYPRYLCNGCGAWSRGRLTINTKDQKGALLVN